MTTWKTVFSDDFPAAEDVDRSKWASPFWTQNDNVAFSGRTGFRNPKDFTGPYSQWGVIPCTGSKGADLRFSTYNPLAQPPGSAFLGSDLHTNQAWGGDGQQVKFEATVMSPNMPAGAVTSVFSYKLTNPPHQGDNRDEIDFEFVSKHWSGLNKEIQTNVYVNSNGGGRAPRVLPTPVNLQEWNTFSLIWTPNTSVEWLINGQSFRKETENIPTHPMHLYLNFWAPNDSWGWAYDGGLRPEGAPGQQWSYYVKSARVFYAE